MTTTTPQQAGIPNLDAYDTVDELYEDCKFLIAHVCKKFQAKYGGDAEEYFAESSFWFLRSILPKWSPDKGKSFSAWVFARVYNHLMDVYREQNRRAIPMVMDSEPHIEFMAESKEVNTFDVHALKRSLSRDAAVVVHLTCYSFGEVHEVIQRAGMGSDFGSKSRKEPRPDVVREKIVDELRSTWEWSLDRIQEAFKEIAEVL